MSDWVIIPLSGILLAICAAVVFIPHYGLIARWKRARSTRERIIREDVLKFIYNAEAAGEPVSAQDLAHALNLSETEIRATLEILQADWLVGQIGSTYHLTPAGQESALRVLRAHRLWERYLADATGFAQEEWHLLADRREHDLSSSETDALFTLLGKPTHDPHGDPIPTATGEVIPHQGQPLCALETGSAAHIVHVEDEPEEIYRQLLSHGLQLGVDIYLIEASHDRVVVWVDGNQVVLTQQQASNVFATPHSSRDFADQLSGERLSSLSPGEAGTVISLSPLIRGPERRRLMDLGILPGTKIKVEFQSPSGDPVAYLIRGATIALRKEQTDHVRIRSMQKGSQ